MRSWRPVLLFAVLLGTFTLQTACKAVSDSSVVTESRGHLVHPGLQQYVDEFARLYDQTMPQIPITLGKLEKGVAGKCYIPGSKGAANNVADSFFGESTQQKTRIVISSSYYSRHKDSHDSMQVVVFHELAHCLLNRGHRTDMMQTDYGEIPRSIMHPVGSFGAEPFFRPYFDYYISELFGPARREDTLAAQLASFEATGEDHGHDDLGRCVEIIAAD